MKVPAGMKIFSGRHKYKAGEELPARIDKKSEDRIKEKGEKVQKKKTETEARLKKEAKVNKPDPITSITGNQDSDK